MRKVLSILLALTLGLTLAYCGDDPCECEGSAACCADCPCEGAGEVCNDGVCTVSPCTGGAECCDEEPCPAGQECNASGVCVCEGEVECCDAFPCESGTCVAGECVICCEDQVNFGYIAGTIAVFPPDGTPAPVAYAVVDAMSALTSDDPTHIVEGDSGADGSYETTCFDMTNYSLALMILSDDTGYDGNQGTWFPTYSGVMEITTNDDRTCAPDAPTSWAVPVELVNTLAALVPPLATIATDGFAIVFVTDADQVPVAGAVLKKFGDPIEDLPVAIYPSANFQDFAGTETSAAGVVIIPGPLTLTNVIPVLDGYEWVEGPIGAVPGFCFTRPLVAE